MQGCCGRARRQNWLHQRPTANSGKVLLHRQLLHSVWDPEYGEEAEYLRTLVKQLRRKLEKDPSRPTLIKTEPGVGYRFMADQLGITS
ncbi:MAG: winged helix-turn-helix domain-containing protein [Dehalococcoidia bacterium]